MYATLGDARSVLSAQNGNNALLARVREKIQAVFMPSAALQKRIESLFVQGNVLRSLSSKDIYRVAEVLSGAAMLVNLTGMRCLIAWTDSRTGAIKKDFDKSWELAGTAAHKLFLIADEFQDNN